MVKGFRKTLLVVLLPAALAVPATASVPDLEFSTILTGYYLASGQGLVADAAGNSYVYAKHYLDGQHLDILVAKLGPQGGHVWTTLIPGGMHDWATGIILDPAGDLLLTGWTSSSDFPVTPDALDQTLTGFRDAFLIRMSAADGSILYCTLLGGDYTDEGRGIALDPAGNIVIAGVTWSTDFPVLDPIQAEPNGYPYQTSDLFVTRIAADGSAMLQSTYLGGSLDDELRGMAIDGLGRIWVAGTTLSNDMPLVDPLQPVRNPGGECFVMRLNAAADAIDFGTYLGGEGDDGLSAVAIGPGGDLYLAGTTDSVGFPTTAGSFGETFVGAIRGCETYNGVYYNCSDMWVARISPSLEMVYATYLGGTYVDECSAIAVDAAGRAHVIGFTSSDDFPPDGTTGSANIVVAGLSASGSDLDYQVSVYSGSANAGHGIAIDPHGAVYVTGAVGVPAEVLVAKLASAPVSGIPAGRAG